MGTIGVVDEARIRNLLNINEAIEVLEIMKENKFRVAEKFFDDFIKYMKEDNEKRTMK